MRLSVVIPCFNAANTIAVQLEALANQNWYEPWEIIASDNGSTDETIAVLENYQAKIPNLRIVDSSDCQGAAHARNVGAAVARGDALAFCDADDEVAPGWMRAMGEALSQCGFVACKREYTKLNEPWILKQYHKLPQLNGLQQYKYPPFLPHAAGGTIGVKRSIHDQIGGFDETMLRLQDTDYCWRIQLAGTQLNFVSNAVVHHRFRHTITDIYHQARLWGEYNVLLYKKYRPLGMPQLSWKTGVRAWVRLLRRSPQVFSEESRTKWVWKFGWHLGRLQGCIKHQVLAL